jgi:hypothetical protein
MPDTVSPPQIASPRAGRKLLLTTGGPFAQHAMLSQVVLVCSLPLAKLDSDFLNYRERFVLLTLLLIIYSSLQLRLVRRHHFKLWLVNPTVQCALFVHLLPTTCTVLLLLLPPHLQWRVGFSDNPNLWWIEYEWLNILSAVALWTGYWSGLATSLASSIATLPSIRRIIRPSVRLNLKVVLGLIVISVGSRLVSIKLGVFGYSSTYDALIAAANYTAYLALTRDLGMIALIAVSVACFAGHRNALMPLLIAILLVEVTFGVLSGFKSAVVLPIIVVGIGYYVQRGRFPPWLLPASLGLLFLAYALIQPFRIERNTSRDFDGTSFFSIVEAFGRSSNSDLGPSSSASAFNPQDKIVQVLSRKHDVSSAAPGVEFARTHETLPPGSPRFVADIFMSPLNSFVPRMLWQGKSIKNLGLWYTQTVMGKVNIVSSTAMYPVTYLNFAGGAIAVFIGFFVLGVIQSALFRGVMSIGGAAVFVAVCMIGLLGHVNSAYYTFFISLFRYVPMVFVAQWFVFSPPRRVKKQLPLQAGMHRTAQVL